MEDSIIEKLKEATAEEQLKPIFDFALNRIAVRVETFWETIIKQHEKSLFINQPAIFGNAGYITLAPPNKEANQLFRDYARHIAGTVDTNSLTSAISYLSKDKWMWSQLVEIPNVKSSLRKLHNLKDEIVSNAIKIVLSSWGKEPNEYFS